jgi:hypothetical protein
MLLRKAVDGLNLLITNLAKRSTGRNLELLLPAQESAHSPTI